MDITHFFSAIGDKVGKIFSSNQILENILVLKTAVILVAISLIISSLALLILAVSNLRFKKSIKLIEPNSSPTALPRMTDQTK